MQGIRRCIVVNNIRELGDRTPALCVEATKLCRVPRKAVRHAAGINKRKTFKEPCMKLNELFLGQLDNEAKSTRRVLERVPEGRNDWKPHGKSMAFGYLAALVAKMPAWIAMMVDVDEFDVAAKDPRFQPAEVRSNR